MPEHFGHRAGLRDRPAEGIISVLSHDDAVRVPVAHDISESVLIWDVDRTVALLVEQSADAASALEGAGQVFAPNILDDVRDNTDNLNLAHKVPAVIEVCYRLHPLPAADVAPHLVLDVGELRVVLVVLLVLRAVDRRVQSSFHG